MTSVRTGVGPSGAVGPARSSMTRLGGPANSAAACASRLVRTSVFTGAGLGLALTAHLLAGGTIPQVRSIIVALTLLWFGALSLTGRERGGRLLGTAVIATQLGLHALFALTPRIGATPGPARLAGTGGSTDTSTIWARLLFCHHGASPITAAQLTAARSAIGLTAGAAPPSGVLSTASGGELSLRPALIPLVQSWPLVGMLAMHLLAAAVMAWWLRCGERAAWDAGRRIVRTMAARIWHYLPAAPRRSTVLPRTRYADRRRERLQASLTATRGPPTATEPLSY